MNQDLFIAECTKPAVVLRQLESGGLPSLPTDPDGRHMSWVMVLAGPQLHYRGELREWDLGALVSAYDRYTEGGFEAPVLAEHDPSVTVGKRLGDLVEVREHDGGVIGMVRWAIPDAADLIESGQIRYTSPGIGSIELHDSGDVIETIFEISVVTSPHQRGAQTHVLAKGVAMPEDIKLMADEEQEEAEEVAEDAPVAEEEEEEVSVETRLIALEAAVQALLGNHEEEEEEDEEMSLSVEMSADVKESGDIAALRAQVMDLQRERDYAQFCSEVVVGSTFRVTDDNVEALFLLHQTDAKAFAQVASTAELPKKPVVARSAVRMSWGRVGSSEVAEPQGQPTTAIELKSLCLAETGGNKKQANQLFLERAPKLGIL